MSKYDKEVMTKFGKHLSMRKEILGLTAGELSHRSGVDRKTLSELHDGDRTYIRPSQLMKVCRAYETDVGALCSIMRSCEEKLNVR